MERRSSGVSEVLHTYGSMTSSPSRSSERGDEVVDPIPAARRRGDGLGGELRQGFA
jgi:hypothetical protein